MTYNKKDREQAVKIMLEMIGENPEREGLQGTPERVVRMWKELFRGYNKKELPKVTVFNNGSDGIWYDAMVTDTGSFYSQCEHHMIPFFGNYYFAYIPHPEGKVLGLSKVARVVDYYSAKLQIQERLVHEIIEHLWKELSKGCGDNTPLGMALVMEGEHLCKTMRGVKKKGKMRTTEVCGALKEDPATRAEFMSWVDSNGR